MCKLQQIYLKHLDIDIQTGSLDEPESTPTLHTGSFLISNYAFSELSTKWQQRYEIEIIRPFISHAFLVWNCSQLRNFMPDKHMHSEDERPMTAGNLFVYVQP